MKPLEEVITAPAMKLSFGRLVRSAEGSQFVFIGYRQNTVSTELWFAEEVCGKSMEPRTYNCTGLATLLRKFPELAIEAEVEPETPDCTHDRLITLGTSEDGLEEEYKCQDCGRVLSTLDK